MTTFDTGRRAETVGATYLGRNGYQVLQQNWRTRYCEIDIVAQKSETIYFVEVKYRATVSQGSGLDYITERKLRQMMFAAQLWVAKHAWHGDYELAVIAVTGLDFAVDELVVL